MTKIRGHDGVLSVAPIGEIFVEIQRKKYEPFTTAILNESMVDTTSIELVMSSDVDTEFITNLQKGGIWTGATIEMTQELSLGWGGFGDLMSAINIEEIRTFQRKEFIYVERGLRQHLAVKNYSRKFDRVFQIFRNNLPEVTVAIVNEYELTAEHVRSTIDKYGDILIIVKTNPNGKITSRAHQVGQNLGVEVLDWGGFYSRLNRA